MVKIKVHHVQTINIAMPLHMVVFMVWGDSKNNQKDTSLVKAPSFKNV